MEDNFQPLISIIVPIYNVEKYLKRCLESLRNQVYKNLEIIMINDGSPDKCEKICLEYSNNYPNFVYVKQKNSGLGCARNKGLSLANGKYVGFVDSDDFILPQMYSKLMYNMLTYNADISTCGRLRYISGDNGNLPQIKNIDEKISIYTGEKALMHEYVDTSKIKPAAWDKLYKKELFDNEQFPKGIFEDERLIYKLLFKASRVAVSNLPLYVYSVNPQSIITSHWDTKYLEDYFKKIEEPMQFFSLMNRQDFINALYYRAIQSGIEMWEKLTVSDKAAEDDFKRLMEQCGMYYKKLNLKALNFDLYKRVKKRIEFWLFIYAPKVLYFLKNKIK